MTNFSRVRNHVHRENILLLDSEGNHRVAVKYHSDESWPTTQASPFGFEGEGFHSTHGTEWYLTIFSKRIPARDLAKRIVEVEMDLTLARSQGYLKRHLQQNVPGQKKLLVVIGVYAGFGSRLRRNVFRGSWMPKGHF